MSELIRVSQVDSSVEAWKVAREIFRLNNGGSLVEDVIPVEGKNEFDVQISDGMRAVVIGRLGQITSISVSEQK